MEGRFFWWYGSVFYFTVFGHFFGFIIYKEDIFEKTLQIQPKIIRNLVLLLFFEEKDSFYWTIPLTEQLYITNTFFTFVKRSLRCSWGTYVYPLAGMQDSMCLRSSGATALEKLQSFGLSLHTSAWVYSE